MKGVHGQALGRGWDGHAVWDSRPVQTVTWLMFSDMQLGARRHAECVTAAHTIARGRLKPGRGHHLPRSGHLKSGSLQAPPLWMPGVVLPRASWGSPCAQQSGGSVSGPILSSQTSLGWGQLPCGDTGQQEGRPQPTACVLASHVTASLQAGPCPQGNPERTVALVTACWKPES
jgi:hypothetical protein